MGDPDPRFCVAAGVLSHIRGILGLSYKALGYNYGSGGWTNDYNVYMVNVGADMPQVQAWARSHPGSIWLMANEPDLQGKNDTMDPHAYAGWFKQKRDALRDPSNGDPTAIIAGPGISEDTSRWWSVRGDNPYPNGPWYLTYMWDALKWHQVDYGAAMPLDILCYHVYGETDVDKPDTWQAGRDRVLTVTNNWQSFWPARDGQFGYPYSKKPLFLTEFADTAVAGTNNPKPWHYVQSDVESFMQAVCDWFRNTAAGRQPSLNRWFWFTCHTDGMGWITYLHNATRYWRGDKYNAMANVSWDSDWFNVASWSYYDKTHSLGVQPTRLELLFRHSSSGDHADAWRVDTFYIGSGSGNSYGGHISHIDSAGPRVWTSWYPGYCPVDGWVTSGQYRVLAYS